ncbi:MAG: thiamine biosynthesis protein ThiS [Candidatus Woesearchaeota archaeon]
MEIYIERENKKINMKFKGKVIDLLKKLNLNSVEVLVVKGEDLLNDDDFLNDKDNVKIMSVVSGG